MLYSNDKHCKSKIKENKINVGGIKEDLQRLFGQMGKCNGDL